MAKRPSLKQQVLAHAAEARLAKAQSLPPAKDAEQVTQSQDGDVLEARSTSRRIKTVEDLLAHIGADLERFEVAASEATKWEVATVDPDGEPTVTELHRVFVRLKPKGGPTILDAVISMVDAAKKQIRRPAAKRHPQKSGLWQVLIIADPHFGKYAWQKTTGDADYDLEIAATRVNEASEKLLAAGGKPARRTIALLGDIFHYDSPHGTTTSGTALDRDGRLQKMIETGCDSMLGVVERSAESCQTDVLIVNGNHDEALTWSLQRIMQERFRNDKRVIVDGRFTGRKYLTYGKNLIGFAHGHRAKKKLPQIMALEAAEAWSKCPYREIHTGHYHSQAAEWQRPIETLDSVVVRTSPAICPPDEWHSQMGFLGARQAMESFLYDPDGGLVSMHIAGVKP
jgi:predicted phosphodiesterase